MREKSLFKIKIILFFVGAVALFGIFFTRVNAFEEQAKTVRVGYPIQDGITMRDEDGKLSGYLYEYLMEISQYTGWNYEFVFADGSLDQQIVTLMEMLEKGEIDILGPMNYDESLTSSYSYTGYTAGMNYCGLFVAENSKLREASLFNFDNIRVGVHNKNMKESEKLKQYAQMNNLKIEQVVTETAEDFYMMIRDGRADALYATDLTMVGHEDMFAVAHFSPMPFYFTTTKGNTYILDKLDYAIATIDQVNPDFTVQLYNKYFSRTAEDIHLSEQEKEYVENCRTLEVVMYENKPPFQYIDSKTGEPAGITVEILEQIAQKAGFTFHYNAVSTYQDYVDYIKTGKADIAADALISFQDAQDTDTLLTLPWSELPISKVFREESDISTEGQAAMPYFLKNVVNVPDDTIFYDSVEECLKSVQKKEAAYCFTGEFCSQFFLNSYNFNDLKKLNQVDIANQKLCFGIRNTSDMEILQIFNKGIASLSKESINEIIYRNTYQQHPNTLSTFLKNNRNFLIALAMSLLSVILVISFYIKNRQHQRISFENKRYDTISNLANEYFYEYKVAEDELLLSEKCAEYFSCEPRLEKFSRRLLELNEGENTGIWQMGDYIVNNTEGSIEISCEMPDQSRQWFKIFSSSIQNKRNMIHAVGKITNIQELKSEQIQLEQKASIDNLTGIYNISAVKERVVCLLEQFDVNEPCALIVLDIDDFKKVNDTFGHFRGDAVLAQTASLITEVFPMDLAGRLGGDEFIIYVRQTSKQELEDKCRLLGKKMWRRTRDILGLSFSCSIGITMIEEARSYDELYQEADAALYKIKEISKNGYCFFEAGMEKHTEKKGHKEAIS